MLLCNYIDLEINSVCIERKRMGSDRERVGERERESEGGRERRKREERSKEDLYKDPKPGGRATKAVKEDDGRFLLKLQLPPCTHTHTHLHTHTHTHTHTNTTHPPLTPLNNTAQNNTLH